jgi:hypothetical protein
MQAKPGWRSAADGQRMVVRMAAVNVQRVGTGTLKRLPGHEKLRHRVGLSGSLG